MNSDDKLKRVNDEGYLDLTAYHSLKSLEPKADKREQMRIKRVLRAIRFNAAKFGFNVIRVKLYDKHTGEVVEE